MRSNNAASIVTTTATITSSFPLLHPSPVCIILRTFNHTTKVESLFDSVDHCSRSLDFSMFCYAVLANDMGTYPTSFILY